MEKEEYEKLLEELHKDYLIKKQNLHVEYALSNNTVKTGDKVTDHIGSIIVDDIKVGWDHLKKIAVCNFRGRELKKNGEFRKDEGIRTVFGGNLLTNKIT